LFSLLQNAIRAPASLAGPTGGENKQFPNPIKAA